MMNNSVQAAVGLVLDRWRAKHGLRPKKRNEEHDFDEASEETDEEKVARLVKSGVAFPDIAVSTGLALPEIYKIFKKIR